MMQNRGLNSRRAILLGIMSATGVNTGGAQEATPSPEMPVVLQEVVVTARKRDEHVLEVPAGVTALTADTIERTKSERLEDYLPLIPGVTFTNAREGQTKITFRGIDNGAANATVVTYVDDTPFTSSTRYANGAFVTPNLDPADIARIEAVRGPQGTLYGANAVGGVLKYVTVKPDPNSFGGRAEISGESVAHGGSALGGRASVNLPLVADTLALRISGYDRHDPGYIDDPFLHRDDLNTTHFEGGRAAMLWSVTDSLTFNLSALTQTVRSDGNDTVDYNFFTREPLYGDLTQHRFLNNEWFSSHYSIYNFAADWNLSWARLLSSTSYSRQENGSDSDLTPGYGALLSGALHRPNTGLDNPLVVHQTKLTEELRLTSAGTEQLDWQVGAFYTLERSNYDQGANVFDTVTQVYPDLGIDILKAKLTARYIEYSTFADVDYHFTPQLDLALGARYSHDDQQFHEFSEGLLIGPTENFNAPKSEQAVTWLVNPRYRLSGDQILYGRFASGYRPGGGNVLTAAALAAGVNRSFDPDHLISYEVGWKATLLDNRLTADIAVYYVDWTDVQLPLSIAGFNFVGNGGKAHSQGVESAFGWHPLTGLDLGATLTYNNNRLDTDRQSNPDFSQAGQRLPGTPPFSGSLTLDYSWKLTAGSSAFVGGTFFFTSDRPNGLGLGFDPSKASGRSALPNFGVVPIYDPNTGAVLGYGSTRLPGYKTLDLRAGVQYAQWTLEAFVKNVTDTRPFVGFGGLNNANFANLATVWGATVLTPRTVGLSLARKF